ncbi:mismatch-specific DNA-glycosylase [Acidisoma silvae]|uniref:Mismatch-specific DNA-glycosylase n=1 Tax=Acidisoma silvae TaxID=2802396 RepID=A0A963YVN9_9PROT|nr:mismatch-specific DNA-glycosylase [Acidisoma silvae]MCB8877242.1 mismatch-specific DNA-glycosylase [Acidisoma silvae]
MDAPSPNSLAPKSLAPNSLAPDILPDLLETGLDLVICGTAAGRASAARGAYYAGPGNRFWPVLAETGLTPHRFQPHDFPHLLSLGIGLTDICKTVSGQDDSLPRHGFDRDRLRAAMALYRPQLLAFNSKRAAAEFYAVPTGRLTYGPQPATAAMPEIWVLPSTSGLACRAWDATPWQAMASRVLAIRQARNSAPAH